MRLPWAVLFFLPALSASAARGESATKPEPCPIDSISIGTGRGLPRKQLPRDSVFCRQLEEVWPDYAALARAAGLDPARHGLYFFADDDGPPNAAFVRDLQDIGVNAAMLSLPGCDRKLLRGVLAHELGHAVQYARGERIDSTVRNTSNRVEGQADVIGAQLMDGAGFGGAAAMREMWQSLLGCSAIRSSLGARGRGHPAPGTRWAGALAVEEALDARRAAPWATRRVLEGDPQGEAVAALLGGAERPIKPLVGLEDVTIRGAPLPGEATRRALSGSGVFHGDWAEHASAADLYLVRDVATGEAASLCPRAAPATP
jgi:hypothetical protein